MISRRKVLKILSSLPFGGFVVGELTGNRSTDDLNSVLNVPNLEITESIYESIGVRPLINARGTVTIVGATRVLPEVQRAMEAATRQYAQLDELMDSVARRLAELTGAEWGMVTSGASGAITAATAGIVSGGDPDKIWQIPDLSGMKSEVIIPSYSRSAYDAAARAVGAKMIEVKDRKELEAALEPKTAMVMVLAGTQSEEGPLSIREIASLTKPRGIPILVDAAAEGLYVPNPHLDQGADLVAYSGGKYLQGPQCAGLLLGRKDLVQSAWIASAPHHGAGRGYKVGREEIIGMLAAVEMWFKRDYEKEMQQWTNWLEHISDRLDPIQGVRTEIRQPNRRSNRSPSLRVYWDMDRVPFTGNDIEKLLWDGNPRIAVSGAGSFLPFPPNTYPDISINSSQLKAGEEKVIADRIFAVLSNPPDLSNSKDRAEAEGMSFAFWPTNIKRTDKDADFNLSGHWDLKMTFSASTADQTFYFEQVGNELTGTHTASMAARNLAGSIHGDEILIRSSYTDQGMRINFTFTGKVNTNSMKGKVNLGEYGMAVWEANRRL